MPNSSPHITEDHPPTIWTATTENVGGDRQIRYHILQNSQPVAYLEILQLWQLDSEFRRFFIELLATASFRAFCWETPPITKTTGDRPFEFVLTDNPYLDREPDLRTFRDYFDPKVPGGITEFPNLGNDAFMVVPCSSGAPYAYVHLAVFMRDAPEAQKHELWKRVGAAMQRRLNAKPLWLSTAGGGVAWLHVRLDSRPKY